jgi:hypothetical protein
MLTLAANPVAQSFLGCLAKANHVTKPFDYWLLEDALPPEDVEAILDLPVAAPADALFSGRRETNNAERISSARRRRKSLPCAGAWRTLDLIEKTTGAKLSDDPGLRLAGTDIHEEPPDFKYVTSAPYGKNLGVISIPAGNTWHGIGHNPISGLRKSIIVNYVAPEWRDTFEVA